MDYIVTFTAMFFVDIVFAFYLKAVDLDDPIRSGFWASMVTLLNIIAVINYIDNHMMVIPAVLGAFAGTYVGVLHNKLTRVD